MYKIKIDFHFMIFIPTYSFELLHSEIINRLLKPCLYLSLFSIG